MFEPTSAAGGVPPSDRARDTAAYREGYARTLREVAWARERGWTPTPRQVAVAAMQAARVYAAARRGKSVAGRPPEWLLGRIDALRTLLREGADAPTEAPGA